ncbi:hypothetical protein QBC37DRAFT_324031 [Rhypophila decipiens]|uniref:Uncharacterized protein n=1 Tax=Rhypophila decipiens TaxID=261697 RepID=A0AAN7B479_9PEZI|nr:hypothetical protein QBC37DRAFT_324031 [Rhypophila decipiens]
MAWRAREIENRAQKCQALRQTPTRDSAFATYTKVLTLTDPAKGIVVTTTEIDNDWELTSTAASSTIVPVPVVSGFVTLTDSNGVPTSTSTMRGTDSVSFRNPLITTMTITGKDQSGVPISTFTFVQPLLKSTITNSLGEPISTVTLGPTGLPDNINNFGGNKSAEDFHPPQSALFHPMTPQEYYLISFLPVFLAIVLSILAQMISSSIRMLLPFHMMTRPGGVSAQDSIAMSTGGLEGNINSIRLLFKFGDPVSFMGDLLVLLSAAITSLSGEAVGIKLEGSCTNDSFQGCFMSIAVFKEPSRALEGLLGAMLVVLLAMLFLLNKWKTGIASNPTSIAAMAALIPDLTLRRLLDEKLKVGGSYSDHPRFLRQREVQDRLDGHLFCLGYFRNRDEKDGTDLEEYGITTVKQTAWPSAPSDLPLHTFKPSERNLTGLSKAKTFALYSVSQPTLDNIISTLGMLLISGLIVLVTYYNMTSPSPPTRFEAFMSSQGFGVEALFTSFGVVLSWFWDYYYAKTVMLLPYRLLQVSSTSTAPISSVTGFPFSVARGEVYPSAAVGFAAILSKFTPTILSTVPFSPAQTWTMHLVCTWSLVACLGFMGIVVLYGLVATRGGYPYLPVGLESVVGRAWYLCGKESEGVVRDFGKEAVNKGDGCRGKRYIFGEIDCGKGHEIRMGIMRCDEESDYDDRRTGH